MGRRFEAQRFEVKMGADDKITHTISTP